MSGTRSITAATPEHTSGILALLRAAFESSAESELVADLLADPADPMVSLVALEGDEVIGLALFTPVTIDDAWVAMGFAPLAVHPDHQARGVGSRLTRDGLDACNALGHRTVFVLGDPAYYPRFGFEPACPLGYRCEWVAPGDEHEAAFMVRGHDAARTPGFVRYHPAFDRF